MTPFESIAGDEYSIIFPVSYDQRGFPAEFRA